MLKNKKFAFFDMDGTLIDSVGIWNQIDQKLIEKLTNKTIDETTVQNDRDTQLKKFNAQPNPYLCYCQYLKDKYSAQISAEEIIKLRYEIAQDFLQNIIDYKPQADLVIKKLKAKNFTLAITTTTKRTNMDIYRTLNKNINAKAPLDEYFDLIYTREDVSKIKPDPEVYQKAMQKFNAKPEECIIFEDSLIGIEAAKKAGIETIAIYDKYSDADTEAIKSQADFYLHNDVLVVVGVLWNQQDFELLRDGLDLLFAGLVLFLNQLAEILLQAAFFQHHLGLVHILLSLFVFAVLLHDGGQIFIFLHQLRVLLWVADDIGVHQLVVDGLIALFCAA